MKRKIYLSLLATLCWAFAWSQTRQVTGRVLSADSANAPVRGVNVTVKGTNNTVATQLDGSYTITIPDRNNVTLTFSSVGYTTQDVPVGNNSTLNVTLSSSAAALNDIVVIGYQTVRRKDVLASVASIGAKDLKDIPLTSAAEALNGRLAGVTATTAEGSPDAQVNIRVRGGISITQSNEPLYIVDGVQVENALSVLSPQDIQSIDVLKDATATAIYGARGANGVIVITTKSGRPGRTVINYNGFVGVRTLAKKLKVLSPYDFVVYQSERSRGSSTDSANFAQNFGTTWDTLQVYKNVPAVDWQDEVFGNTGVTTTHNVSASGGSKKATFNLGYTYNYDKPVVLNSNFRRHIFNAKGDYKITKDIKIGAGARYTNQDVVGAGVSSDQGTSYNRLRNAVKYRPFLSEGQGIADADPLADPNVGNGLILVNPIELANAEYRRKTTESYNLNANLTYNITRNLTFRSTFGYDHYSFTDRQYSDSITPYAATQGGRRPIAGLDTSFRKIINNSNVLTYSVKNLGGKHDFDVLLGEETNDTRIEAHSTLLRDFPLFTTHEEAFSKTTSLGTLFPGYPNTTEARATLLSFFGRINYSYADKYLLSVNVREDGSSKFASGRRWGTFPGGSVAWRISRENFMRNVSFINELKLRLGYGKIGNNRINDYLYLSSFFNDGKYYYGLSGEPVYAYYEKDLVNSNLVWESLENRNLGLDATLFNRRLDITVDVYNNTSDNLLLNVPIAPTFGFSQQIQNVGKTKNKGYEVALTGVILRNPKGLNWNANFNISHNTNTVVALGPGQDYFYPSPSWGVSGQPADYIVRVGDPVGSMWGLVTDGFYTVNDFNYDPSTGIYTLKPNVVDDSKIIGVVQPGSIKFRDLNNDDSVDLVNDRTIIGNPNPKFTGGLNQQFTYKNWDLSLFVNFSIGNDVYNANKIEFTNAYSNYSNMLDIMENRWKVVTPTGETAQWVSGNTVYGIPPDQLAALNANATIWQPLKSTGAFYPHSWAIENGSFLRLNNLTIGYTLPTKSTDKIGLSRLRFYLTGNNLAIITNYTGYDPEVSVRNSGLTPGLDYSAYPKSRMLIFGVNATF